MSTKSNFYSDTIVDLSDIITIDNPTLEQYRYTAYCPLPKFKFPIWVSCILMDGSGSLIKWDDQLNRWVVLTKSNHETVEFKPIHPKDVKGIYYPQLVRYIFEATISGLGRLYVNTPKGPQRLNRLRRVGNVGFRAEIRGKMVLWDVFRCAIVNGNVYEPGERYTSLFFKPKGLNMQRLTKTKYTDPNTMPVRERNLLNTASQVDAVIRNRAASEFDYFLKHGKFPN